MRCPGPVLPKAMKGPSSWPQYSFMTLGEQAHPLTLNDGLVPPQPGGELWYLIMAGLRGQKFDHAKGSHLRCTAHPLAKPGKFRPSH